MRTTCRAAAFFCAALVCSLTLGRAPAEDLTTVAGKKLTGKLVGVDKDGVTFLTGEARVKVPGADIVAVDFGNRPVQLPKDSTYSEVELTDGSVIRAEKFVLKDRSFDIGLLPGPKGLPDPTFDVPMRTVLVALRRAEDVKLRDAWKQLLTRRGKRDMYVQRLAEGLTTIPGTILEGKPNKDGNPIVILEREDAAKDELLQSRAAGLVFYTPQPAEIPPTICRVHDVYGSQLNAAAINVSPEGAITVTTVAGATVKYPSAAALVKLDYAPSNLVYLSDLDAKVDAPPVAADDRKLAPVITLLKDQSFGNAPLKLDNVAFGKGLCVAPDTVVTYTLNGDYAQFKSLVGIDENGSNATSAAKLTVEADGVVLFSETLTRKDKPKPLVLAVKGVKQLRLIVEADTPFNGNFVILADARVQK